MTMAIARRVKHASLALLALSSVGGLQSAFAVGTDAGTSINNRATVNYSVGGVAQTEINSSPTGNSTPGAAGGADTTFVVDRRVFMSVADEAPSPTELSTTVPGGLAVIRRFTITNTSNREIGFRFPTPTNLGGDQFDATNLTVRVDSVTQPTGSYTPGTYDSGADTATTVVSLTEDHSVTVYVLGDIPATVVNGNTAIVNLQAIAIEPTVNNVGVAGTDIVATAGANTAGIDTVFGDAGNDGAESDTTIYSVSSASLSVTKTATVISDPFTGVSPNAKAIPGATIEYTITVDNTGAQDATTVTLSDPIPANTTYVAGSITVNAASVADAGRTVGTPVTAISLDPGVIAAGASAEVTFRVTINATP